MSDQSSSSLHHFQSLHNNWIASLLSTNSSDYTPVQTYSRIPKPSTGEDGYFAQSLASPSTIPHVLSLRRRNIPAPPTELHAWPAPTAKPSSAPSVAEPDMILLVDLGAPGICGHPETVHGGVVATLLDEAMSVAVALHAGLELEAGGESNEEKEAEREKNPRGKIFTAQLDLRYKRPLLVPAIAMVKAKVVARQGRKFWVRAQIVQEEKDENAEKHLEWPKRKVVTTDAMAFWLQTRDAHL